MLPGLEAGNPSGVKFARWRFQKCVRFKRKSNVARGGVRPGAGRPRKPLAHHRLVGTYREDRHGDPRGTAAAVLKMPAPAGVKDWRPAAGEAEALSPRAQDWLQA